MRRKTLEREMFIRNEITNAKSVAVLGMGKFGRSLAEGLYDAGYDVMVVDKNEEVIRDFASQSTLAINADLEDEEQVKNLGLGNMDIVVVAMGTNLAASIICVAVAKEQGVPYVIVKNSSERMAAVLKKVGADKVFAPEEESGIRMAKVWASRSFLDFYDVDDNFCIIEMIPKPNWIGKSLKELDLRKSCSTNVVAVKGKSGKWSFADPDMQLKEDMTLLIASEEKDIPNIQ